MKTFFISVIARRMIKARFYITAFLICFLYTCRAQTISITDNNISRRYSFINTAINNVSNPSGLDSFYSKLYTLKTSGKGVVSIVHIGDSHTQADFLSGVVRKGLQEFFGNAGRGLVFPYQLAQSNGPPDITSSSATRWQFNRVAHPEIAIPAGISGYGIQTNADNVSFRISLKPDDSIEQSFNRLKLFVDTSKNVSWIVQAENTETSFLLKKDSSVSSLYTEVLFDEHATGFTFSSVSSDNTKEFYGVSLENSNPGILYHTIGVNGARYDQYNNASLFWKQLAALNADLFIISLGTNEAQYPAFNEENFHEQLSLFIQNLKTASPQSSVLVTTTADSYKQRKRFNTVLRLLNSSLIKYCNQNSIPAWDLYRITKGYGSALNWVKNRLINRDRIHFTAEGYRIQGNLLFNAIAKGYNSYIKRY